MDVAVEKIGFDRGKERFVLVNVKTGAVITKSAVSEPAMRKFLRNMAEPEKLVNECFAKARQRFEKKQAARQVEAQREYEDIFGEIAEEA